MTDAFTPDQVLDFWFPDEPFDDSPESFGKWIYQRMQGGMDERICNDFAPLTRAAAEGRLDHWADTPDGRLALILALDQFPRSLWRGTPGAYAQDIKAARLCLEGIGNGHFDALDAFYKQIFYVIALTHCEGPDHLARFDVVDEIGKRINARLPPHLSHLEERFLAQQARVRGVIERFGRHPHRNPVYGRVSTPEEQAYIDADDFPHVQKGPPPG